MARGTTARHLVCLSSVDEDKASPHWQKNSMYTHAAAELQWMLSGQSLGQRNESLVSRQLEC